MKGATINTSNSISFGDTSSLNNAGNYEVATICSIEGDKVYMFFNLLNQYTISGKVQLVKFAEYSSAIVTDTIKAAPWNNATGTGGVIAISVKEDLTLNAPVYADSSGFRGGSFKLSSGSCGNGFPIPVANAYYYDANVLGPQMVHGKEKPLLILQLLKPAAVVHQQMVAVGATIIITVVEAVLT